MLKNYTPMHQKILRCLWDGEPHTVGQIMDAMGYDRQDSYGAFRTQISLLNTALKKNREGFKAVCISRGRYGIAYQLYRQFKPG